MKSFFKSIPAFFKRIFGKSLDYLKSHSEAAVKVTNTIKQFVESPIPNIIVNIIPGDVDDVVLVKLRQVLPIVVDKLAIAHNIIQSSENPNETVANVISYLKGLNKDARVGFWLAFSGELNLALNDGKISFPEAVSLTQMAYSELYAPKA